MTATTKKKNYNDKVVKFIRYNKNSDTIFKIALLVLLSVADILLIVSRENQKKQPEENIDIHNNQVTSTQFDNSQNSLQLQMNAPNISFETHDISDSFTSNVHSDTFVNDNNENLNSVSFYDKLLDWEIQMLEITVQHEVGNFSKEYKTYVAELIYNRILSDDFPDTVTDVLFQSGQFQGISNWLYSGIVPDEETKEVVKAVFSQDITSHPATFYYNPALSEYDSIVWFEYSGDVDLVFEYTENNWGIDYTTRFFV